MIPSAQLYDATKRYGDSIEAEWPLDLIKETVGRFDFDGDGKINRDEFRAALDNLVMKKPAKGGRARKKSLQGKLQKAWTFKKGPSLVDVAQAAVEADAHERENQEEAEVAAAMEAAMAPAMTLEQKEAAFWEAQESQPLWKVPFGLNRDRMPWAADGTTGMSMAIARARAHGKTPLIVDPSFGSIADSYFVAPELEAKVLKARYMFEDEQQQKRTHGEVMNDTRKLLVDAMREGKIFYIQLDKKVTDFAGGNYSAKDTLPMAVFDQREVAKLEPYYPDNPRIGTDPSWTGLWKSDHPFAQVLRDGDLDMKGRFFVHPEFEVVICTLKKPDEFLVDLRNSMPMGRLQPILPLPGPL
jgi:hypothetical protein